MSFIEFLFHIQFFLQVKAEIDVINASWDSKGKSNNLTDSIGIMVYNGTQSLHYVKNYVDGPGQGCHFPITCRAPPNTIFLGVQGSAGAVTIGTLVNETITNGYRGIMTWYSSVMKADGSPGLRYALDWDSSGSHAIQQPFIDAINTYQPYQNLSTEMSC